MPSYDTVPEMPAFDPDDAGGDRVPCLLALNGVDAGRLIRLDFSHGPLTLGRDPSSAVCIPNAEISRRHAQLRLLPDGSIELADLNSRNGSFVNREQVTAARLRENDRLQFGPRVELKFVFHNSDERELFDSLYARAGRDALTSALTRQYFMDAFQREWSFSRRHHVPIALVMIDLDRFKWVNDTHGHPAGDAVLAEFAERMRQVVRNEDLLGRYGGEEFVLLLRDTLIGGALIVAERCRRAIADRPFRLPSDERISVTASFGVVCYDADEIGKHLPAEMIEAADRYLYRAKEEGRNRVRSTVGDPPQDSDPTSPSHTQPQWGDPPPEGESGTST
ncbi:MAG: GGDEF domain-containing protein [Myxococcales bacterium]|nr:GGDEF domain-containing protein [Myxococcales bacterium]